MMKQLEPLANEARKYKSAEEFVKWFEKKGYKEIEESPYSFEFSRQIEARVPERIKKLYGMAYIKAKGRIIKKYLTDFYDQAIKSEKKQVEMKEPWEMTKGEYKNLPIEQWGEITGFVEYNKLSPKIKKVAQEKYLKETGDIEGANPKSEEFMLDKFIFNKKTGEIFSDDYPSHREEVEWALKQGKSVPEEVLKDYPDLVGKYKPKPTEKYAKEKIGKIKWYGIPTKLFGGIKVWGEIPIGDKSYFIETINNKLEIRTVIRPGQADIKLSKIFPTKPMQWQIEETVECFIRTLIRYP